jgi:hypothetical protein
LNSLEYQVIRAIGLHDLVPANCIAGPNLDSQLLELGPNFRLGCLVAVGEPTTDDALACTYYNDSQFRSARFESVKPRFACGVLSSRLSK